MTNKTKCDLCDGEFTDDELKTVKLNKFKTKRLCKNCIERIIDLL